MCEVGRVFPRYVQSTCLTGKSPLGCPRVARTLRLYNYLLRFHLTSISIIIPYSPLYLNSLYSFLEGHSALRTRLFISIYYSSLKTSHNLNRNSIDTL